MTEGLLENSALLIGVLGIAFGFLKWLNSNRISNQRNRRESISLLTDIYRTKIEEMSPQEILIAEEAISSHYNKPLYLRELDTLLKSKDPKRAVDFFVQKKRYLIVKDGEVINEFPHLRWVKVASLKIPIPLLLICTLSVYALFAFAGLMLITTNISSLVEITTITTSSVKSIIYSILWALIGVFLFFTALLSLGFGLSAPSEGTIKKEFGELYKPTK